MMAKACATHQWSQSTMQQTLYVLGLVYIGIPLYNSMAISSEVPSVALPRPLNDIIEEKLSVYKNAVQNPRTQLQDTLRFLYTDVMSVKKRMDLDMPELEARLNTVGEAQQLFAAFAKLTANSKQISVADQLSQLYSIVQTFNPLKFARIRTAYPVMRCRCIRPPALCGGPSLLPARSGHN
jgi:hypothetical protein